MIPKKLQRELPYRLKPKFTADELLPAKVKRARQAPEIVKRSTALVLEPEESRLNDLMQVLQTVRDDALAKEQAALKAKQEKYKKVRPVK